MSLFTWTEFTGTEISEFNRIKQIVGNPRGPLEDFKIKSLRATILTSVILWFLGFFFLLCSMIRQDFWSLVFFLISVPFLLSGIALRGEFGQHKKIIQKELVRLKNEEKMERFLLFLRTSLFSQHYHAETITDHLVEVFLVFAGSEFINLIFEKIVKVETSAIAFALAVAAGLICFKEIMHLKNPNDKVMTIRALKAASKFKT